MTATVTSIATYAISALTVVGLIVLIALNKITWGEGGPLIAALAGVHGGAALSKSNG